jgi:hypothetical protein
MSRQMCKLHTFYTIKAKFILTTYTLIGFLWHSVYTHKELETKETTLSVSFLNIFLKIYTNDNFLQDSMTH